MKAIIAIVLLLIFGGCEESFKAYSDFTAEHGTDSIYYCDKDTDFLMNDYINKRDDAPHTRVITDNTGYPVECIYIGEEVEL